MVTVACVLRSGGDFGPDWVRALRKGVARHLPADHRFVCLTDMQGVQSGVPLRYGWPKWWSKLELFRPGAFVGQVLYMDLDTLPVGDLSDIAAYAGEFAMIEDLFQTRKGKTARLQSGVMAFTPGPKTWQVWEQWIKNPDMHMKKIRGDGEWLAKQVRAADRLQVLYPGQIVSLKRDAKDRPPAGARLVCGHGRPRLNMPAAGWAHRQWKETAA